MSETVEVNRKKRYPRNERRKQILQALVQMLEENNGEKLSTARLATAVGMSEAGLYRSFASKGDMFDALIDFIEDSVLGLFTQIRANETVTEMDKVQAMVKVLLDFATLNPGLTSVLTGKALVFENPELTRRLRLLLDRMEVALKQTFREAVLKGEVPGDYNISGRASLVMSLVVGKWLRFVISDFKERPSMPPAVVGVLLKP